MATTDNKKRIWDYLTDPSEDILSYAANNAAATQTNAEGTATDTSAPVTAVDAQSTAATASDGKKDYNAIGSFLNGTSAREDKEPETYLNYNEEKAPAAEKKEPKTYLDYSKAEAPSVTPTPTAAPADSEEQVAANVVLPTASHPDVLPDGTLHAAGNGLAYYAVPEGMPEGADIYEWMDQQRQEAAVRQQEVQQEAQKKQQEDFVRRTKELAARRPTEEEQAARDARWAQRRTSVEQQMASNDIPKLDNPYGRNEDIPNFTIGHMNEAALKNAPNKTKEQDATAKEVRMSQKLGELSLKDHLAYYSLVYLLGDKDPKNLTDAQWNKLKADAHEMAAGTYDVLKATAPEYFGGEGPTFNYAQMVSGEGREYNAGINQPDADPTPMREYMSAVGQLINGNFMDSQWTGENFQQVLGLMPTYVQADQYGDPDIDRIDRKTWADSYNQRAGHVMAEVKRNMAEGYRPSEDTLREVKARNEAYKKNLKEQQDRYAKAVDDTDISDIINQVFKEADKEDAEGLREIAYSGRKDDFSVVIDLFAGADKTYDPKKLQKRVHQLLPKEKKEALKTACYNYLHSVYPTVDNVQLTRQAALMADSIIDDRTYAALVAHETPKSVGEYWMSNMLDNTITGSLIQGAARVKSGTAGRQLARMEGMEKFGQNHKWANFTSTAVGYGAGMLMTVASGGGGLAARGVLQLAGRTFGKTALRKLMTTYGGKIVQGMLQSGLTMGFFEGGQEGLTQFRYGGTLQVNPETGRYEVGPYSIGAMAGSFGHGSLMGSAMGGFNGFLGNVGNKLVQSIDSTWGKLGARTLTYGAGFAGETTIFAAPDLIQTQIEGQKFIDEMTKAYSDPADEHYIADAKQRDEAIAQLYEDLDSSLADVWTDTAAMTAAFRLEGTGKKAIKSVTERLAGMKKNPNARTTFERNLRRMLDNKQFDLSLSKDEKAELEKYGYGDLNALVNDYAKHGEKNGPAEEGKDIPYNRFADLVQNKNVSLAARAKMYWLVTGKVPQTPTIIGGRVVEVKDAKGNITGYEVLSNSVRGEVVTRQTFTDKKKAEKAVARVIQQSELNSVAICEMAYNQGQNVKALYEACQKIGKANGVSGDLIFDMYCNKKPQERTEAERQWTAQVVAAIQDMPAQTNVVLAAEVGAKHGVNIDKALGKMPYRRSQKEVDALEDYLNRLTGKQTEGETAESPTTDGSKADAAAPSESAQSGYRATAEDRKEIALAYRDNPDDPKTSEAMDGVEARIEDDADYYVGQLRFEEKRKTHTDGNQYVATLEEAGADGKPQQVYVVSGDISANGASDGAICVYNPATGKTQMVTARDLKAGANGERVTMERSAADINAAMDQARSEFIDKAYNNMYGQVDLTLGSEVTMPDGKKARVQSVSKDGTTVTVQIGGHFRKIGRDQLQKTYEAQTLADYRARKAAEVANGSQPATNGNGRGPQPLAPTGGVKSGAPVEGAPVEGAPVDGTRYSDKPVSELKVGDKFEWNGKECTIYKISKLEDGTLFYNFEMPDGSAYGKYQHEMERSLSNGEYKIIDTTPTADGGNVPAEGSSAPISEGAMPIGEDGNPQWRQTTPERGRQHLYGESGLDKETADTFVANKIDEAQKALDTLEKQKPQVGTNLAEYQKAKAEHDAKVAEAQAELDYWKAVRGEENGETAEGVHEERKGSEGAPVEGSAHTEGDKTETTRKAEEVTKEEAPVGENEGKPEEAAPTGEGTADSPTESKPAATTPVAGPTPTEGKDETTPAKKYGEKGGLKAEDYEVGDRIMVYDGEGNPVEGTVTRRVDSQGKVMVSLDNRINGRRNMPFSAEELSPVIASGEDSAGGDSAATGGAGTADNNSARSGQQPKPAPRRTISAAKKAAVEAIAKALGVKSVEWVDTMEANGEYDPKKNTIKIAMDAEHPLAWVFGHETVHRIKNLSPEAFNSLKTLVKDLLGEQGWKSSVDFQQTINEGANNRMNREGYEEEAVCEGIGQIIENHDMAERLAKRLSQNGFTRTLNELYRILKEMWNTLRGRGMSDDAKKVEQTMRTIEQAFADAKKEADKQNTKPGDVLTNAQGDVVAEVDSRGNLRPEYSNRTYRDWTDENGIVHQGTRGRIYDYLVNKGMSAEQIDHFMETMDYWEALTKKVADLVDADGNFKFKAFHEWSQRTPLYKKNEEGVVRAVSSLVANGEYPLNVELSTDCIKRETFTQMLNEMLKFDGRFFTEMTPAKISDLQTLQKSYGIQVACPLCFVEGKRLGIVNWAQKVCDKWNEALDMVTMGRGGTPFGFGKGTYVPDKRLSDETPERQKAIIRQLNEVSDLLSSYDGVLPKDLKRLKRNQRAAEKFLQKCKDEYAEEHGGSTEGFVLTATNMKEMEKLANKGFLASVSRMVKAMAQHPELRHRLEVSDLIGSKGLMAIREQDGEAFSKMYSLIVSANGTGTPKIVQDAQPYDGEIIDVSDTRFNKAEKVGGTRLFSFSDFDLTKVFDIMQIMFDSAARGAKIQSYSKEVPYILMFGKCGVKINMSMLPEARPPKEQVSAYKNSKGKAKEAVLHQIRENAGLEIGADGKIKGMQLSDSHSISQEFTEAIYRNPEYNKNCGATMVGISVNHAIYAMCQDFIRQVIPFHLSGMSIAAREKSDCIYYRDFTSTQNTGYIKDGERVKLINGKGKSVNPKVNADFNFYEGVDQPGWNMRDRCRAYIEWCKKNDCVPRFEWAVNSEGYRTWCKRQGYTPNQEIIDMMDARTTDGIFDEYYKVITDYTAYSPVFDAAGNKIGEEVAPHRAVTTDFGITQKTLSMVLGVDETGKNINDNSMLANRERSIANANAYTKEIAYKAVQILGGNMTLDEALKPGGTEFQNNADNDIFMEQTGGGKKFSKRKNALNENESKETVAARQKAAMHTAVSNDSTAKVLKALDSTKNIYEKRGNRTRGFITDISRALGLTQEGPSHYRRFTLPDGNAVELRVSNHSASAKEFDERGEREGLSIVISGKANRKNGYAKDSRVHLTEYFFPKSRIERSEGKPLVDIIQSLQNFINTGVFEDKSGLALRQEINSPKDPRYSRREPPVPQSGIDQLRKAGVKVSTDVEQGQSVIDDYKASKASPKQEDGSEKNRFFKTADGEVYGFVTPDGEIFIDPRVARDDTPIHEYSHLWTTAYKQKQPERWDEFVRAAKAQTDLWDYVTKTYKDLKTDDEIADEVFAHFSGKQGAERLRKMQQEILQGKGDIFEKAAKVSAIEELKRMLKDAWRWIADKAGWKRADRSISEFADMTFRDLAKAKNPVEGVKGEGRVREQFIGEKGAANMDAAEEATTRLDNLSVAREMEEAKKDAKAIKLATGWERGADGKWRYEILDFDINPLVDEMVKNSKDWDEGRALRFKSPRGRTLGKLIGEDNSLFDAYPSLKDVKVRFLSDLSYLARHIAYFDGVGEFHEEIMIRSYISEDNIEIMRTALNHEVQHAIQRIEGFSPGGIIGTRDEYAKRAYEKVRRMLSTPEFKAAEAELRERDDELRKRVPFSGRNDSDYQREYSKILNDICEKHPQYKEYVDYRNSKEYRNANSLTDEKFYHRLAGEVESRNVQKRMNMTPEERRNSLAAETEDVAREDQIFLNEALGKSALIGDPADTFKERQKRAVKEKGVVSPGLNEAEVDVVSVPKHNYTGNIKEATKQAIAAATAKYAPNGKQRVLHYDNHGQQFDYAISGNAVEESLNPKQQNKSDNKGAHLAVAEHIDEVIGNSIEVEEHPDYAKNDSRERDGININDDALMHRFYGAVNIDGTTYRVMTLMSEKNNAKDGNGVHAYEVQKIEVLNDETPSTSNGVGSTERGRSTYPVAKLLQEVEKSYDPGKKLLDESQNLSEDKVKLSVRSNQVDENGDPVEPQGVATVPTPERTKAMRQAAERTAGRMNLKNVVYHDNTEGQTPEQAESRGWFDPATGKIYINVNNNLDEADATTTILHEATAHYGLRKMFGKDFEKFLYNVFSQGTEDVRRKIAGMMQKNGLNLYSATEEYLAGLAESQNFTGVAGRAWQTVKSLFRDMLRGMGLVSRLSDTDLRDILLDSYDNLTSSLENNGATEADPSAPILYRKGSKNMYDRVQVRDRYERRIRNGWYQSREALQDSMLSLRDAMLYIVEAEGGGKKRIEDIDGYENAYLGENRLSSVNQAEMSDYATTVFKPLLQHVATLAPTKRSRDALVDYMFAKHGLERQDLMSQRAAKEEAPKLYAAYLKRHPNGKKTLADFEKECLERDYAGLTALTGVPDTASAITEARKMVDDYEAIAGKANCDALWTYVNNATKTTLKKSYDSGLLSKKQYDDIRGMYDYYIPLRGFDQTTAENKYAYLAGGNGKAYSATIRKARGRGSKADDPFANMEAMAETAIMQGNRNTLVKQRFLDFVENHPSDLCSVSRLWLQYDAPTGEWRPVTPKIDRGDTPAEVERKMREFDNNMRALKQQYPQMYKTGKEAVDIPFRVEEKADEAQHHIIVYRGGEKFVITVNGNPRLAQAINGQTNPNNDANGAVGFVFEVGEALNRQLSALFTTRNPDFIVSNFVRDSVFANVSQWVKDTPGYAAAFHVNWAKYNPLYMGKLFNAWNNGTLDMSNPHHKLFRDFMMNGGETGYVNMRDVEKHKSDIARELKRMSRGKADPRVLWRALGERFDEANRAIENTARFAAFVTSLQLGRNIERAIWDAKEVSVNFNKKGSGATFLRDNLARFAHLDFSSAGAAKESLREMKDAALGTAGTFTSGLGRSLYVFWNAAIQGSANYLRQTKAHPAKGLAQIAGTFMLGALVPYLAQLWGSDDDDDKNNYFNIAPWTRRANVMFSFGEKQDSWFTIPIPVEYRVAYGMGELMSSALSGKENMSGTEIAEEMLGQISQALPLDMSGEGAMSLVPSQVKPLVEVGLNKSWTGQQIYNDSEYKKNDPEWAKHRRNTASWAVDVSQMLSRLGGGNVVNEESQTGTRAGSDWYEWNPDAMEYLVTQYTGGIGTTISNLVKTGETLLGDREFSWNNTPMLKRLLKEGDERNIGRTTTDTYFKLKEEADKTLHDLKAYNRNNQDSIWNDEIYKMNYDGATIRAGIIKGFEKSIKKLNAAIKYNPEKREYYEGLKRELYRKAIERMKELGVYEGPDDSNEQKADQPIPAGTENQ